MAKRSDAARSEVAKAGSKWAKLSPSPVNSRQTRSKEGTLSGATSAPKKFIPKHLSFEPMGADELKDIEEKGAWESIVSKYEVKFGVDALGAPRQPPRIPLCRLLGMEAVRNLQEDSVERLKKGFKDSGYVAKLSEFHITGVNEAGETLTVADVKDNWDPIWTRLNQEFELECDAVEEFKILKDKMFWVFDGNHRFTAWSSIAAENPDKLQYHPCVRFSLLDAGTDGFKRIEQAMHALNS